MIGAALFPPLPPGHFVRYLAVGVWNPVFRYASFALLTAILDQYTRYSHLAGSLLSSLLNSTVS